MEGRGMFQRAMAAMRASNKRQHPDSAAAAAANVGRLMADFKTQAAATRPKKMIKAETTSFHVVIESLTCSPANGTAPASIEAFVILITVQPTGDTIARVACEEDQQERTLVTPDPNGAYLDANVAVEKRPNHDKPLVKSRVVKDNIFHALVPPHRFNRGQKLKVKLNGELSDPSAYAMQAAVIGGLEYETYTGKNGVGYSWKAASIELLPNPAASLNLLSRLRFNFAYQQQLLPAPSELETGLLQGQSVSILQTDKEAKKIFDYSLPLVRFEVANIGGRYVLPSEQYLTTPAAADDEDAAEPSLSGMVVSAPDAIGTCYTPPPAAEGAPSYLTFGSGADRMSNLKLHVIRLGGSSKDAVMMMIETRLFAHHFVNAPWHIAAYNDLLMKGTATVPPMAVTLVVKPDPVESFNDTRVIDAAPDGTLQVQVEKLFPEFRRHTLRYAIPVTADAVLKGFFGVGLMNRGSPVDETLPDAEPLEHFIENSFPAGKYLGTAPGTKGKPATAYKVMTVVDYASPTNPERVVVMDAMTKVNPRTSTWATPGIRYFVLPMGNEIPVPLEADPTADPDGALADDAGSAPMRCAIQTPEQGDVHVLDALKKAKVFPDDAADLVAACAHPLRPFVYDMEREDGKVLVRFDPGATKEKPGKARYLAKPYFCVVAVLPCANDNGLARDYARETIADVIRARRGQRAAAAPAPAVAPAAAAAPVPAVPGAAVKPEPASGGGGANVGSDEEELGREELMDVAD